jgi:hypothetical protein
MEVGRVQLSAFFAVYLHIFCSLSAHCEQEHISGIFAITFDFPLLPFHSHYPSHQKQNKQNKAERILSTSNNIILFFVSK